MAIYRANNPDKLPEVSGLIQKYGENRLLTMARKKYSTVVTFVKPGTLGLRFTPNSVTGNTELLSVNPGTQAESHPELKPGMILTAVDGRQTRGLSYPQTLEAIKTAGRPLPLTFVPGGSISQSVLRVPPKRHGATNIHSLTDRTAAAALHGEIAKNGTKNVAKIDRLRRASLQSNAGGANALDRNSIEVAISSAATAELAVSETSKSTAALRPSSTSCTQRFATISGEASDTSEDTDLDDTE